MVANFTEINARHPHASYECFRICCNVGVNWILFLVGSGGAALLFKMFEDFGKAHGNLSQHICNAPRICLHSIVAPPHFSRKV